MTVPKLVKHLAEYIVDEIKAGTDSSRGETDRSFGEDSLRLFFAGPSGPQLDQLFHYLTREDGKLVVEAAHGPIDVPVFLVDPSVDDPTQESHATRCTPSYLVVVRNRGYQIFLALHEVDVALPASLLTAMKPLGVGPGIDRLDRWVQEPLVQRIIGKSITEVIGTGESDVAHAVINHALSEAWELDERTRDKPNSWKLLERLTEIRPQFVESHLALSAVLGLPACNKVELGGKSHLATLDRVKTYFQAFGLRTGLDELKEVAGDLLPHILAFGKHLEDLQVNEASEFARSPLRCYCPFRSNESGIPDWWQHLTVEAWSRLLDAGTDTEQAGNLEVHLLGPLAVVPRSLPSLAREHVELEITVHDAVAPVEVVISRASGQSKLVEVGRITIEPGLPFVFKDDGVPDHERFVRYKLEADGYSAVSTKVIVLDKYGPGVVACVRGAKKASPFKLNKKAKDEQNKSVHRFECDIELTGMGSHTLDLYTSIHTVLSDTIVGREVNSEQDGVLERPLNKVGSHHSTCLVETDEECFYDFDADTGSGEAPFRIFVTADEVEPTGATSEFDRLVIENRGAAKRDHTSAQVEPVNCRAANLEEWALEDPESFRPLIIGPDYLDAWRKPDWKERPVLSGYGLPVDPRPTSDEFRVPEKFAGARKELIDMLGTSSGESTPSAGMLHLHAHMLEEPFRLAVHALIDEYAEWIEVDYDAAAWVDVVAVHALQPGVEALEATPYAVLLAPLHPVRLAWQCQAQEILQEAIRCGKPCPAASMLNPAYFPDCLQLPCRSGSGQVTRKPYAAVASSSDYWSVLWSLETVRNLAGQISDPVFGTELGISVDGLSSGFTAQQVIRAMDEVSRLVAAKSTLRMGVSSDTAGAGSCNEGIGTWCTTNLGPDNDHWVDGGPKSLVVVDHRELSLQPEQAAMASLTSITDATLRWFKGSGQSTEQTYDLSIIAHLGTMSHEFTKQGIRSAIDPSGLARWRIRKQLPGHDTPFIAESRLGDPPSTVDANSLAGKLLGCVDRIESRCSDEFDSFVFAPNMSVLGKTVDSSSYTAVSSSNIDAACFFRPTEKVYLWDYELPSYARRAGENSGYFLLARRTEGMLVAIQSALSLLGDYGILDEARILGLLEEISRRGMPTLKGLTSGGSVSVGEVGMLVSLRVLQSDFDRSSATSGLLPVRPDDGTLNLIVPADPFKNQFEDLRVALENRHGERPDLLVLSFNLVSGIPMQLKITPLEVKARGAAMSRKDRVSALSQASHFGGFLAKVQTESKQSELWGIAWRSLISTLIDYGFRVYGQLDQFMQQDEWALHHSAALRSLANGDLEIEVDKCGRLLVVDDSNNSVPIDLDQDEFHETIAITLKDAFSILADGGEPVVRGIRQSLDDWGLKPFVADVESGVPKTSGERGGRDSAAGQNGASEDGGQEIPVPDRSTAENPPADKESSWRPARDNQPPAGTGIKFQVGETIQGFNPKPVHFFPGNTELNQLNVGVVGDLGTGKTQLVQSLVYQLRTNAELNRGHNPNILIFDYKKDYCKPEFVEAIGARVIEPFDMPLNLFDTSNSPLKRNAWLERSKFFCDVLGKIYTGIGPVQRERIKSAVKEAYGATTRMGRSSPTMGDVFDAYRAASDTVDAPYSIMSDLVDGGYFVEDESAVQPFSNFLDGVVVIDLAEIGQDDKTKNMLVVIFLNLFYEHMLRIEKKAFIGSEPQLRFVDTMLLVDEADNIMKYEFEILKKILLQSREFGVGVLLASQYLSHFKTAHENYREPLLTWFVHKVPNISVKDLEGIGLTNVGGDHVNTVKSLKVHECLYKTLGVDGDFIRGTPFYQLWTPET